MGGFIFPSFPSQRGRDRLVVDRLLSLSWEDRRKGAFSILPLGPGRN